MSYEEQGTAHDAGAAGHELQGRSGDGRRPEFELGGDHNGDPIVEVPSRLMRPPAEGETIRVGFGHLVAFCVVRDVEVDPAAGTWSARLEPKAAAS